MGNKLATYCENSETLFLLFYMKKLSKLKLREYHEMSDMEMKHVIGGESGSCSCTGGGCAGSCPDRVEGNIYSGFRTIKQTCTSEIVWNYNNTEGIEICVCK